MDCLDGYIGIKGCSDSEPESGLYINDLPGISIASIDGIANAEKVTYVKVFEDISRRALRRFATLVNNWLAVRYQLKTITQSANLGTITTTAETAASASKRGFTIFLSEQDDYVKSNLHVIHIQSLNLILKEAKNTTIKVYDIVELTDANGDMVVDELDSFVVTGQAGKNRIAVNEDYKPTLGLFVAYDSTDIDSLTLEVPDLNSFCGCVFDAYGCEAKIQGAISTDLTNVSRGTNTYGLSGIISIGCKFDQFVCDNRQAFSTALWFLYGHEYWNERIYTDRLNRYGTIDKEKAEKARNETWTIFNNELQTALDGVHLDMDCCLECSAQVKMVEVQL